MPMPYRKKKLVTAPQDEVQTAAEAKSIPQLAVNETEPRFIGSLKKKLCSVGLGLNVSLSQLSFAVLSLELRG